MPGGGVWGGCVVRAAPPHWNHCPEVRNYRRGETQQGGCGHYPIAGEGKRSRSGDDVGGGIGVTPLSPLQ